MHAVYEWFNTPFGTVLLWVLLWLLLPLTVIDKFGRAWWAVEFLKRTLRPSRCSDDELARWIAERVAKLLKQDEKTAKAV